MQFEFRHEFDASLDVLELALMSPQLGPLLGDKLEMIESVHMKSHDVDNSEFRRVWRFQARAPLKILSGYNITRDMMMWDEYANYRMREHSGEWHVVPRPGIDPEAPWRASFSAKGTYQLDPLSDGRTRRTVAGDIYVKLKLIGKMVERIAIKELRKMCEAEAEALEALCSLT